MAAASPLSKTPISEFPRNIELVPITTTAASLRSESDILNIVEQLSETTTNDTKERAVAAIKEACRNTDKAFSLLQNGVFLALLKCPHEVCGAGGALDILRTVALLPQSEKNEESRKAAYARMEADISTFNTERIAGSSWFSLPFFSPPPPRGVAFLRSLER